MANYYQLLDLDPDDADPDRNLDAVRRRVEEKNDEWANPTHADPTRAAVDKARVPEMRAATPAVWRDHAAEERERLRKEKVRAEALLGDYARGLAGKAGGCSDQDAQMIFNGLKKEFGLFALKRVFRAPAAPALVRKWLEVRGVSFGAAKAPPKTPRAKPLPQPTTDQVFRDLETLVRAKAIPVADLYGFLAAESEELLTPQSSEAELLAAANTLEAKYRNLPSDALLETKKTLAGSCRTILGDKPRREQYDLTLALRVLAPVESFLRLGPGGQKVITPEMVEQFARMAAKLGVSADLAGQFVDDFAERATFTVIPAGATADRPACGFCHTPAAVGEKFCPGCGKGLSAACPNPKCKETVPTTRRYCKCGYAVGDAPLQADRLAKAEQALAAGDIDRAADLARAVLGGWKDYPAAVDMQRRIGAATIAREAAGREVRALLADRKGQAARDRLGAPDAARLADRTDLVRRADELLAAAAAEVASGRQSQAAGRPDDAIDRYEEALRRCADHSAALAALAACPPDPPARLEVAVTGPTAALRWVASPARGTILYRVVRKVGTAPRGPDDGTPVGTVPGISLTDPDLPVGEPVYYAVYSRRGEAASAAAATAPPAFRVADVTRARAVGRDGCVELTWEAPAKATAVEVWRKAGEAPADRGDGEAVPVAEAGRATDLRLKNSRRYGYRVVAAFRGPDGQPRYAPGVEATATPVALPRQVTDLRPGRASEHEVEAHWTPPRGDVAVAVFVCGVRPTVTPGTVLAADDLAALGQRLDSVSPGYARGPAPPAPVVHLIPVSLAGATGVVGPSARLSAVPDVTGLRVRFVAGQVSCRWDWPAGVKTVVVVWRAGQPPAGPTDPRADRRTCEGFEYEQHGGFRFDAPDVPVLHLAVFAVAPSDTGQEYAPGGPAARSEVPLRKCARVDCDVKPVRRWFRLGGPVGYALTIVAADPVLLPELIVLVRAGEIPIDREDGDTVYRVPADTRCEPDAPYTARIPTAGLPRTPRFRVFTADPAEAPWLDL